VADGFEVGGDEATVDRDPEPAGNVHAAQAAWSGRRVPCGSDRRFVVRCAARREPGDLGVPRGRERSRDGRRRMDHEEADIAVARLDAGLDVAGESVGRDRGARRGGAVG
jgi:hypothetical protein